MRERTQEELEFEMDLVGNLTNHTSVDDLVAMYYGALNLISTQADMSVIDVHNELIIEPLNATIQSFEQPSDEMH